MTVSTVELAEMRALLGEGAQLVEVLPREEYEELHLPGAIHIALKQLDAESVRPLDRDRDVIVYCWDALCDMSPRAASRLATLGFSAVHDYAAGKVDWLAHALPAEGTHAARPTAGSLVRDDAVTCSLHDTGRDVLREIDDSRYGFALVLSTGDRVLLGRVRRSVLESADPGTAVESVMEAGPSTIRPHLSIDEVRDRLARSDARTLIVTTPGGSLLGLLPRDAVPTST